jgi:hypothetical protein
MKNINIFSYNKNLELSSNKSDHTIDLFTISVKMFQLPDNIITHLEDTSNQIIANNFKNYEPFNSNLAGAIKHEYIASPQTCSIMEDLVIKYSRTYFQELGDTANAKAELTCDRSGIIGNKSIWWNFQRKFEYNPLHCHDGILSFVAWVKIPFDIAKEESMEHLINANGGDKGPHFKFIYPNFLSRGGMSSTALKMSQAMEGKLALFPSWLHHEVPPFYTSNDFRVSIAGNIRFK